MNFNFVQIIFLLFGTLSIAYSIALSFYFTNRRDRAIQNWTIGGLMLGGSAIVTVFRADITPLISVVLANAVALQGYRFFNHSVVNLSGSAPDYSPSIFRVFAEITVYSVALYFIRVYLGDTYQTIFVSTIAVIVFIQGGLLSIALYKETRINLAVAFSGLYFISAALWAARVPFSLMDLTVTAFDTTHVNILIFVSIFLALMFRFFIFPGIVLRLDEMRKEQVLIRSIAKANKTVSTGALSASIAHEINQPLAASSLNIEILKEKLRNNELTPEFGMEVLSDLENDNQRAANIIRSLRSIFTEASNVRSPVGAPQLVGSIMRIVQAELAKQQIKALVHVPQGLVLQVNPSEIQQVLLNLVNNAISALSGVAAIEKSITVDCHESKGNVRFSVTDNGPGIAKDQQAGLFDLLGQSNQSGMGLGLWLCRHMVVRHRGRIWYEDAPGGGARFVVYLPQAVAGPEALLNPKQG
jgi:signal transduction histidine kinase